ncbi:MAG: EAL domain-containing protein [Myxococcaceae bacterium]
MTAPAPVPDTRPTVLVVDDDDLFLRVCGGLLKRAGLAVETLNDPSRALERIEHRKYDAIVSDVCMPEINGISLLKAVREIDRAVPVVLMTGAPSLENAISAIDLGVHKFLPKPFDVDAFVGAVKDAVARRHLGADQVWRNEKLDRALEGLWMAFQPIVVPGRDQPFAYEALLRTRTKDIAGPNEFITLAEETRRLFELGRVIRSAVAREFDKLPDGVDLFVNLHPEDLDDPDLYRPEAPLSRHARRVVLEITERASVASHGTLHQRISSLRELGYRIALDDLGAGYSGLTTLSRILPEFVKLDASLVRDIDTSGVNQLIVTAVLDLAGELGARVVAEAIETPVERAALEALGVELMQGFHFARPAPLPEPEKPN